MKRISLSMNPNRRMVSLVLAGVLLASGTTAMAGPTESEVLASLTKNGVQYSLTEVADTARELADSATRLCEQRDAESFLQARSAWRNAYLAWRRASPFLFGPAAGLNRYLGKSVNDVVLDAVVTTEDFGHLKGQPDARGYAAAEYLLFVPADAPAATAADRCAHLRDVTGEIADRTARVRQEWDQSFGPKFMSAGDGKPFLIPGDALSLALAEALNTTERLLRDHISIPSGYFEGAPRPDLLAAWRSKSSRDAFQAVLEGLRMAVIGNGNSGMAELVATRDGLVSSRNPALAAQMRRQIEKIEKVIADLGGNDLDLHAELAKNPDKLKRLYQRLQELQDQLIEASLVLELDVRTPVEMQGN
jgi:predicted lipoprotein